MNRDWLLGCFSYTTTTNVPDAPWHNTMHQENVCLKSWWTVINTSASNVLLNSLSEHSPTAVIRPHPRHWWAPPLLPAWWGWCSCWFRPPASGVPPHSALAAWGHTSRCRFRAYIQKGFDYIHLTTHKAQLIFTHVQECSLLIFFSFHVCTRIKKKTKKLCNAI